MCFLSYVISFSVSFLSWMTLQRFYHDSILQSIQLDMNCVLKNLKIIISVFIPFVCICLLVFILYPSYWHIELPVLNPKVQKGVTKNENPWMGALNPVVTITEFTDYECFQCKKMHNYLRNLIDQYPEKIRLIHRHYPMDAKFNDIVVKDGMHYGAGYLALIAIHAARKGEFWKVNDLLYNINVKSSVNLSEISQKTGYSIEDLKLAITNPVNMKILQLDILTGAKLRITGTPTYLVEGKLYQGFIPKDILKEIITPK